MSSEYVEQDSATPDSPNGGHDVSFSRRKRRSTVRVACNSCRTKKTRCDGRRPICGWCASRPGMECVYDTETAGETRSGALRRENELLRKNLERAEGLLHDLATLSEVESMKLLKRLRYEGKPAEDSFSAERFRYPTPSNMPRESPWTSKGLPSIQPILAEAGMDRQPTSDLETTTRNHPSTSGDSRSLLTSNMIPTESSSRVYGLDKKWPAQLPTIMQEAPRRLLDQNRDKLTPRDPALNVPA